MANTYTNKLKLRLPAKQDPDWEDEFWQNAQITESVLANILAGNGVLSGLLISNGGGLDVDYESGGAKVAGTEYPKTASSVTATASSINYIYVNSSGVVTASTTPPTGDFVFLGIADANATTIGRVSDARYMLPTNVEPNAIINGCCRVAQRSAPNISGTYQYGEVDRIAAKAGGTPTAGTISQSTSPNVGLTGFSCKIAGLTTGAGGTADFRYRIESKDVQHFIDNSGIFHCLVHHDVSSAIDYTVTINKADAEDDFSAVTQIAASPAATSVANTTETQISLAVADLGACGNGIEIIVNGACGAVTTKNFEIGEFGFIRGYVVTSFDYRLFPEVFAACQRYFEKSYDQDVVPGAIDLSGAIYEALTRNNANLTCGIRFAVEKRDNPTVTIYATDSGNPGNVSNSGDKVASASSIGTTGIRRVVITGGDAASAALYHFTADAEL